MRPPPNPSNYYEALVNFDKQNQTDPVYKLALNSLKSAWRQKNLREKRKGKTEFSIVISNEKKKKLKTLARQQGKTLGETLEDLINNEIIRNKEYEEKIKNEKKTLKQMLNITREAHKIKINELEKTTTTLLHLLKKYVLKMIQHEIGAYEANHPSIYEHMGSKKHQDQRIAMESEIINKELKKLPSWNAKKFPFL